ncbi:hypothetical protein [Gordonia sp. CPCC 205333]|uniref:hypothetical protein n=1 Tax=Gordonia sp. CPCC 205333 TaxID=3140790 RepID=UPI003AF33210
MTISITKSRNRRGGRHRVTTTRRAGVWTAGLATAALIGTGFGLTAVDAPSAQASRPGATPAPSRIDLTSKDCHTYQRLWVQTWVVTHPGQNPTKAPPAPTIPGCLAQPGMDAWS